MGVNDRDSRYFLLANGTQATLSLVVPRFTRHEGGTISTLLGAWLLCMSAGPPPPPPPCARALVLCICARFARRCGAHKKGPIWCENQTRNGGL